MSITPKERELAAVGASVASGCKPCTNYHIKAVREAGATDEEIKQVVAEAVRVRQSATEIMESHALSRLGEAKRPERALAADEVSRVKGLVWVGAAFGVNCVSSLKRYLDGAETAGISHEEIAEVVRLAAFIKERAASHVEQLVGLQDEDDPAKSLAAYKSMFGA